MDLEVAIAHIAYADLAAAFEKVTGHPAQYIDTDLDDVLEHPVRSIAVADMPAGYNADPNDKSTMSMRDNFTVFWNLWKYGIVKRDYALLDEIHPNRIRSAEERSTSWSSAPASPGCTWCTGCAGWGSRCAPSKPATTSAAPGTGTATRVRACDIPSVDYMLQLRPGLETEWTWSEKYATQPEILRYLNHVADKYDLRRDIQFATRVEQAALGRRRRRYGTSAPTAATTSRCRFYVMATGCLSMPKEPDIDGVDGSPVRCTSPAAGPTRVSTSPASGWRSSARVRRASSRFRSSPSRPRS